jgi:hypothetical protein
VGGDNPIDLEGKTLLLPGHCDYGFEVAYSHFCSIASVTTRRHQFKLKLVMVVDVILHIF